MPRTQKPTLITIAAAAITYYNAHQEWGREYTDTERSDEDYASAVDAAETTEAEARDKLFQMIDEYQYGRFYARRKAR